MATLYASTTAIRAEAAKLDPVKVFLTIVLLPMFVLGWTARFAWVAFSLLWTGAVYGWRTASKRVDAAARQSPPAG